MPKRIAQFSSPPRRSTRRSKTAKVDALSDLTNSSPKPSCRNILEDGLLESYPEVGFLKMSPSPFHKRTGNNPLSSFNKTPKSKQKLFVTELSTENGEKTRRKLIENDDKEEEDENSCRRSKRKTKAALKKESLNMVVTAIRNQQCVGLAVKQFDNRGRGIVTTKAFHKGEFIVEYSGDLIDWKEAQLREVEYSRRANVGCYMYYFSTNGLKYCIDATEESGKLGRLCNHSRRSPNTHTKLVWIPQGNTEVVPHLIIVALRDIDVGEEITYDYGDRDKEAVECHPWLKH